MKIFYIIFLNIQKNVDARHFENIFDESKREIESIHHL